MSGDFMDDQSRPPGKTTMAPEVLVTIARLTTLSVPGVSRLANIPPTVNRLFRRKLVEGVEIVVEDNVVYVDLFVILNRDVNVRDTCHNIQLQVTRSISEMVGMEVGKVNIHVEDIDYTESHS
jgi:uncharacterized alkaline shock family protein YloU